LAEVRRRYEAIGGRSPMNDISRRLASKLEKTLGVPVRFAARLWSPYPREVLAELALQGIERVVVLPLAQHSAHVYGAAVQAAADELGRGSTRLEIVCAPNWGREPLLIDAYAQVILEALGGAREPMVVVMTAHSLPLAVLRAGDAYEREVRASAELIAARLGRPEVSHVVAFQSRGMDGGEWLGPDLETVLRASAAKGARQVVIAPIGFLADHVEILYDLDIEARDLCRGLGVGYARARSLNDSDALVHALAAVAAPRLAS
jgi:ferrochelatase